MHDKKMTIEELTQTTKVKIQGLGPQVYSIQLADLFAISLAASVQHHGRETVKEWAVRVWNGADALMAERERRQQGGEHGTTDSTSPGAIPSSSC